MESAATFTLAIESAIGGGSISLLDGEREVANWLGGADVLRAAEDLLPEIDKLTRLSGIKPGDISLIAVSAGPGSFTGIRIGLATALGLKTGLGISMGSQSALTAMAFVTSGDGEFVIAVPAGRTGVYWQRLRKSRAEIIEMSAPSAITEEEFSRLIGNETKSRFIVHSGLAKDSVSKNIIDFGTNIAKAVGLCCGNDPDVVAQPIFISKNIAARV